jgi:uncharacterized delta-60 repeat protein
MSASRRPYELVGQRARAAAVVAAAGMAVASVGTAAFGSDGAAGREFGAASVDLGNALAAGRDGKLAVAGVSRAGGSYQWAVARYTPDGRLDRRFGLGGKVLTAFGRPSDGGATALAIRPDGRIVAAGWAYDAARLHSAFALVQYTVRGELDQAFGRRGKVLTSFGSRRTSASAYGVAIRRDGKVVAVGHVLDRPDGRQRFALARYTRSGRLDPSFGRGGKVITDFGGHSSAAPRAVAIQPDRKVVVAGSDFRGSRTDIALARYKPDGSLDRSFGQGGRAVTKVGDGDSEASALVVQRDGKLVVAGGLHVVRFTADGKLDPSFGDGGVVVTHAGYASGLALQRDRKLVMAGTGSAQIRGEFALARFLEDGSPDESFGRSGRLLTLFPHRAVGNAVVLRADGKIVMGGTYWGQDFLLARYNANGELDGSFGRRGKVMTDFLSVWRSLRP